MLGIESHYDFEEGKSAVQRVNPRWYSDLGVNLKQLTLMGDVEDLLTDHWIEVSSATSNLYELMHNKRFYHQLRASRPYIQALLDTLEEVTTVKGGFAAVKDYRHMIAYNAKQLLPVLNSELGVQNCYLISPKRAYDIEMLTEDALKLFSESVQGSFVEIEKYDIRQAGRCLAFEIPTAALFHMLRAADSVLRRWYEAIIGTAPKPKTRNWGTYIKNLRASGADEKIVSALEHVKDLHRNPIIHPETEISIEEALSFVGIAESIISSMLADLAKRKATISLFQISPASAPPLALSVSGDVE